MNHVAQLVGTPLPPGVMMVHNHINDTYGIVMPDGETYVLGRFRPGYYDVIMRAVAAWVG